HLIDSPSNCANSSQQSNSHKLSAPSAREHHGTIRPAIVPYFKIVVGLRRIKGSAANLRRLRIAPLLSSPVPEHCETSCARLPFSPMVEARRNVTFRSIFDPLKLLSWD